MKKELSAEFFGTFGLVFVGTTAAVLELKSGVLSPLGVSLAFGLVLVGLIYAFGHISGGHFNPAVTIALLYQKGVTTKAAVYYIITQCVAAIFASVCVRLLFGNVESLGGTAPANTAGQAFLMEFIITFIFAFVIVSSTSGKKALKDFAPIGIGFMLGVGVLIGGPVSGGSLNPARSLGPALVSGSWSGFWIYLLAPILGALLASVLYTMLLKEEK